MGVLNQSPDKRGDDTPNQELWNHAVFWWESVYEGQPISRTKFAEKGTGVGNYLVETTGMQAYGRGKLYALWDWAKEHRCMKLGDNSPPNGKNHCIHQFHVRKY